MSAARLEGPLLAVGSRTVKEYKAMSVCLRRTRRRQEQFEGLLPEDNSPVPWQLYSLPFVAAVGELLQHRLQAVQLALEQLVHNLDLLNQAQCLSAF